MSPERQVTAAPDGQNEGMRPAHSPLHVERRRPATSWPAALLPGALLVTLLTTAAGSTSSGRQLPATELHVVDAAAAQR
jgi:hypothetical protein